ncbi:MAG: TonB-dependent receptor [Candidatus Eremiobacteraeota bacterium]|nr:TonB-dependent receptor [Candidatus Eremiobacteraeota bacterium]
MRSSLVKSFYALAGAAIVSAVCASPAAAATTTGGISGTVSAATGSAPLQGVAVTATSPSGTRSTTTDAKGFYAVDLLNPDTYTVTFSRSGYETATLYGISVFQDQTVRIDERLAAATRTIGRVAVTASTNNLVQKNEPANVYNIAGPQLAAATGGDDLHKTLYEYMQALPGVTANGYPGQPRVRGGQVTDLSYEFDGIPIQERITGFFTTNLSNVGVSSVQLYTGGYGAEYANAGTGVLNSVVKTGTYPHEGRISFGFTGRDYNHRLMMDYGSATPDHRYSYYVGFDGVNSQNQYNYGNHTYPDLLYGFFNGDGPVYTRDMVGNFHFRPDAKNDFQLLLQNGYGLFDFDYLLQGGTPNAPLLQLQPCAGATTSATTYSGGAGGVTSRNGIPCPQGLQFVPLGNGNGNKWDHYSGIGKVQWNHSPNDHSVLSMRLSENFNQYIFDQPLTDPNYTNLQSPLTFTNTVNGTKYTYTCPAYPYAPYTPLQGPSNPVVAPNGDPTVGECTQDIEDFYGDRRSNMYVYNLDYDDQRSDRVRIKVGGDYESDRNLFRYYLRNFFDASGWPDNYLRTEAPTHLAGAYVQTQVRFNKLLLQPGVRYDREWYGVPGLAFSAGGYSPRFAGTYGFDDANVVRFSYGTTDNLIGSGYVYRQGSGTYNPGKPNFSAQPQINHSADLMFEHQFRDQVTSLRAGPWYHKTDNYYSYFNPVIGLSPSGAPIFSKTQVLGNAGHNSAFGAEFALNHALKGDGLSWWLTGTYDNYWTTSTGTAAFVNFPIDQARINSGFRVRDTTNPLFSGSISADWRHNGLEILPFAYYQTKAFYNVYALDANSNVLPEMISGAWWYVNGTIRQHLHDKYDTIVGLRVQNITDQSFNTTPCLNNSAGTGCYPFDGPQSGFSGPPNQFVRQNLNDTPTTYEVFFSRKL